ARGRASSPMRPLAYRLRTRRGGGATAHATDRLMARFLVLAGRAPAHDRVGHSRLAGHAAEPGPRARAAQGAPVPVPANGRGVDAAGPSRGREDGARDREALGDAAPAFP